MTQGWAAPFFQKATLLINESKSPKTRLGRGRCEDFMSTLRSPSDCFPSEFWPPNMRLWRHPTLGKTHRGATHCAKPWTPLIFWDDDCRFGAKHPSSASKREGFFFRKPRMESSVSSGKDCSLLIWGRSGQHPNPCLAERCDTCCQWPSPTGRLEIEGGGECGQDSTGRYKTKQSHAVKTRISSPRKVAWAALQAQKRQGYAASLIPSSIHHQHRDA